MIRVILIFLSSIMYAAVSNAQSFPLCEFATSDSDGDGYGWENDQSCIVRSDDENNCEDRGDYPWGWNPVTRESCLLDTRTQPGTCVDTDGDGYGWNGIATCIVSTSQCEDRGGYPWGWNPATLSSCRLDEKPSQCVDTDGDGSASLNPLLANDSGNDSIAIDGVTYFAGSTSDSGSELSAYDPASAESKVIADIFPGVVSSLPSDLTELNGMLYLTARDPITQRDFWVYDPATAEAPLALNLFANDAVQGETLPGNLTALDNKIYFTADEFEIGNELMVYDPQAGAIAVVTDIYTGAQSSDPRSLVVVLGKLYFSADNGTDGRELWVHDPATNTSTMVTDLSTSTGGSDPGTLYVIDDKIYYNTRSGGQTRVYDPQTGARPALLEFTVDGLRTGGEIIGAANSHLILRFANDPRGAEPWQYNTQTNITSLIADINPGAEGSRPFNFVFLDNTLFFRAEATFGDFALWTFDYTTGKVKPSKVTVQAELGFPGNLAVHDDRLYFTAESISGSRDRGWWVYDPVCD